MATIHLDPFLPEIESPPLSVTQEQLDCIRRVLELTSSDSRMAQKAYIALERILTYVPEVKPEPKLREEKEEEPGILERLKDRREEKKEERREKPDNTLPETQGRKS